MCIRRVAFPILLKRKLPALSKNVKVLSAHCLLWSTLLPCHPREGFLLLFCFGVALIQFLPAAVYSSASLWLRGYKETPQGHPYCIPLCQTQQPLWNATCIRSRHRLSEDVCAMGNALGTVMIVNILLTSRSRKRGFRKHSEARVVLRHQFPVRRSLLER